MRVAVNMFFNFEGLVFFFEHHRNVDIHSCIIFSEGFVVFVLHIPACKFSISSQIHIFSNKCRIHIFYQEEPSVTVNQWLALSFKIVNNQRSYTVLFGNPVVVGTKCGRNVHNSGTIFGSYKIAGYHSESVTFWFYPVNQLFVVYTFELTSGVFSQNAVWYFLVALGIIFQRKFSIFRIKMRRKQVLCQYQCYRVACIWVESSYF